MTVSLLAFALVFAGCEDDKVETETPKTDEKAPAENGKKADEEADEKAAEDDGPSYESLADAYGELETTYDEKDEAPAGLAAQMREWGQQMMYMHEHDGHMMGQHGMMGEHGMKGMHGGGEGDEPGSPSFGPHMPAHMSGFGQWHRQMSDFHQAEAKERKQTGDEKLAQQHRMMARRHAAMAEKLESEQQRERVEIDEENLASAGKSLYENACATCHADNGAGVTQAFPPLAGAEMVTGDKELLIRITLHGMEGPLRVKDENYNGFMPSFAGRFSNQELAAILTYIRTSWGNDAGAVSPETVGEVREETRDSPGALSTIKEGLAPTVE